MTVPLSLGEALESGSRLKALQALREVLGKAITSAEPNAIAALARQLTIVLAEIEELAPPEQKGTALDELNARRSARGSEPPRQSHTAI